jgi:soluble P-type ATPase
MVRKSFQNSPCVLAIGDGHNDAQMMHEANFSIEVIHKNSFEKELLYLSNK